MAPLLERTRSIAVSAALLCVPLVFWPWAHDSYSVVKNAALMVYAAPALAFWWLAGAPGFSAFPAWYRVIGGSFLAWACLRTIGTEDISSAIIDFFEWVVILMAVLGSMGLGERHRLRALSFLSAGAAAVSLIGIAQHIFGWEILSSYSMDARSITFTRERVFSTFGNPIFFAGFLILVIPVTVAALFEETGGKRTRFRYLLGTSLLLQFIALILASSRGAFIGLAAAAVMMAAFGGRLRKWIGFMALGGLLLAGTAFLFRPAIMEHLSTVSDPGRIAMWRTSLRMVARAPLAGSGLGQFAQYYPCLSLEKPLETPPGAGANTMHAHNDYLEAAVELGIPGALLFILLVAGLLVIPAPGLLNLGIKAGILAVAVNAAFNFPFHAAPSQSFVFLLPAVFFTMGGSGLPRFRPAGLLWLLLIPACAVLARPLVRSSYFQWGLAYQDAGRQSAAAYKVSARMFYRALMILPDDNKSRLGFNCGKMLYESGDIDGAQAMFEGDLGRFPCYPESYGNLGVVFGVRAMRGEPYALSKAGDLVRHALSIRPSGPDAANDYNSLGNIMTLSGDKAGALENYRKALDCNPGFVEAGVNAAMIMAQSGRRSDAVKILEPLARSHPEDGELQSLLRRIRAAR